MSECPECRAARLRVAELAARNGALVDDLDRASAVLARLREERFDLRARLEAAYEALEGEHLLIMVSGCPARPPALKPPQAVESPLPAGGLPRVELEDGAEVAPIVRPLPAGLRALELK